MTSHTREDRGLEQTWLALELKLLRDPRVNNSTWRSIQHYKFKYLFQIKRYVLKQKH